MSEQSSNLTIELIRRALTQPAPTTQSPPRVGMRDLNGRAILRPAGPPPGKVAAVSAVLVLLFPGPQGPTLVLTRRTSHLPAHAGQIALPGGAMDPKDEDLFHTALRETQEEVGIATESLAMVASLDSYYVVPSNFIIHPFVAITEEQPEYHPSDFEVAEVLEVPVSVLLDPATLATETWDVYTGKAEVTYFRFGSAKIWGATASILDNLLDRLEAAGLTR